MVALNAAAKQATEVEGALRQRPGFQRSVSPEDHRVVSFAGGEGLPETVGPLLEAKERRSGFRLRTAWFWWSFWFWLIVRRIR